MPGDVAVGDLRDLNQPGRSRPHAGLQQTRTTAGGTLPTQDRPVASIAVRKLAAVVLVLAVPLAACDGGVERTERPSGTPSSRSVRPTESPGDGDSPTASSPAPPGRARCTLVLGFSQTNDWYLGGGFESRPGVEDARWELIAEGGHDVWIWSDSSIQAYRQEPVSPCDEGPDRAVFQLAARGWQARPVEEIIDALEATLLNIRTAWPTVERIELVPVVGGPDQELCELASFGGRRVDASAMNPAMTSVIAQVVNGEDVVAGPNLLLADCSQYRDGLGHLGEEGARYIASVVAEHYAT